MTFRRQFLGAAAVLLSLPDVGTVGEDTGSGADTRVVGPVEKEGIAGGLTADTFDEDLSISVRSYTHQEREPIELTVGYAGLMMHTCMTPAEAIEVGQTIVDAAQETIEWRENNPHRINGSVYYGNE